jgi:hypothetical protein
LLLVEYAVPTPSLFPLVHRGAIPGHPKASFHARTFSNLFHAIPCYAYGDELRLGEV